VCLWDISECEMCDCVCLCVCMCPNGTFQNVCLGKTLKKSINLDFAEVGRDVGARDPLVYEACRCPTLGFRVWGLGRD